MHLLTHTMNQKLHLHSIWGDNAYKTKFRLQNIPHIIICITYTKISMDKYKYRQHHSISICCIVGGVVVVVAALYTYITIIPIIDSPLPSMYSYSGAKHYSHVWSHGPLQTRENTIHNSHPKPVHNEYKHQISHFNHFVYIVRIRFMPHQHIHTQYKCIPSENI